MKSLFRAIQYRNVSMFTSEDNICHLLLIICGRKKCKLENEWCQKIFDSVGCGILSAGQGFRCRLPRAETCLHLTITS